MSTSFGLLFNPSYYAAHNPDLAAAGITTDAQLTSHFLNNGLNEGRGFSPYIDLKFYSSSNPDLAAAGFTTNQQLFNHLETSGVDEGRKFSPFVDLNFYNANNPDLAKAGFNTNSQLLQHLEQNGVNEGRRFSPFVDLNFYNADNPDLTKAGFTTNSQLLQHLEDYGLNEGRKFSPFVDLNFYKAYNPDLAQAGLAADSQLLQHLEQNGVNEGRRFSPFVDLNFYNANNPDLTKAGFNTNSKLLQHLEQNGVNEGRRFSPFVDLNFYRANNSDLAQTGFATDSQLLNHLEIYGSQEGRAAYPGQTNPYIAQNGGILSGFDPSPSADLVYHGGKTIANLNYANFYLGGSQSWSNSDIKNIDFSLSQAMSDQRLNSIMAQYFPGQKVTSNFLGSRIVDASVPSNVSQQYIETLLEDVGNLGGFNGFDLSSTVFDFMLPQGTVLSNDDGDSLGGLGGYHGSVNFRGPDGKQHAAYYAIGAYSETYSYILGQQNGIPVFNPPWQNVVATTYHELNEARTDPNVGESNRTGNRNLLGWYSDQGGEVGDYPITEAGQTGSINSVFWYVPLVNGQGTVPIQYLYSNAVHGPENPDTIALV